MWSKLNALRILIIAILIGGVFLTMSSRTEAGSAHKFSRKDHYNWKIALCYHPMYLLIDEDRGEPIVGERTVPWGAPTAEEYAERVRRNLAALEADPKLKLNYEWSGYELDDICRRFPDIAKRMQQCYRKGQLGFLNGDYSQAHAITYGSESAWRQYEYGHEVYQRLFGKTPVVHATQESDVHPQLPQILRQFGFKYFVPPAFQYIVKITKGPFELAGSLAFQGIRVKQGEEFILAVAPDGSKIPTYFATLADVNLGSQMMWNPWSCAPVFVDFPDMAEYRNPKEGDAEVALLEKALDERFAVVPPRAEAQFRTDTTYVEGTWAEEHLRNCKRAEEAATLTGNILAMAKLAGKPADKALSSLDDYWRTILKYEHHDVCWTEVTDLRRKAINNFKEAAAGCGKLMDVAAGSLVQKDEKSVAIFNGEPRPRRALLQVNADQIPGGGGKFQKVGQSYVGFRDLPAGGFRSFPIAGDNWADSKPAPMPTKITTDNYTIEFSKEGLIKQITTKSKRNLLASGDYIGGQIRAVIGGEWVDNNAADCRFYDGDVCYVLERSARLGAIPLFERYYFFKHYPAIKATLDFDFNASEVGDFHIDETKINVYYPTVGSKVYHDMPFYYDEARQGDLMFATNWLYCGGLVYVNRGTIKHWVRNGVIADTLAWGGTYFSNRIGFVSDSPAFHGAEYDVRLYGKQKIEYFLIPSGAFNGQSIVHDVEALTSPVFITSGKGEKSFYEVQDKSLAVTSLYEKDGQVWVRGYQMPTKGGRFRNWEIFNVPLRTIQKHK